MRLRQATDREQALTTAATPVKFVLDLPAWLARAECRGPDAPPMFEDAWGTGREGVIKRTTALKCCLRCPVRLECGEAALEYVDSGKGNVLYGMVCGIEFTDVTPARQEKHVFRLRAVVAHLELTQQRVG